MIVPPPAGGRWYAVPKGERALKVLKVLKFDGPSGRGLRIALTGNAYKVSVTGFTFCVIWHEKHFADWLAALATPYPGCAIGHTFGVRVDGASSPCDCPTACGGKVVRSTKGGKGLLKFLSLTGLWPEGGGGGFAANFIMPPGGHRPSGKADPFHHWRGPPPPASRGRQVYRGAVPFTPAGAYL